MKKIYTLSILMITCMVQINAQQWTTVTTPSATGVAYMTVANNKLFMAATNGVYSSADGITWDSAFNGMNVVAGFTFNTNVYNYNNVMYSGAQGLLYKSVDFGANWTSMAGAAPASSASNNTIYVKGDTILAGWGDSKGMSMTFNGGSSWTNTLGSFNQSIDKNVVYHNGNIYVKTLTGVFKSTDMGANFTKLAVGLPTFSGSVGALTVSNGTIICTIYTFGTYISSDEGSTWIQITPSSGLTSDYGGSLFVHGGRVYLGCTQGKVFRSDNDGATWTEITGTGINSLDQIKCFCVFNGDLYAGGTYALYKTPLGTTTEEKDQSGYEILVFPNPVNDHITFATAKVIKDATVKMYDVSGKLLLERNMDISKNQVMDISGFSKGLFIIEIQYEGIASRYKIIKT